MMLWTADDRVQKGGRVDATDANNGEPWSGLINKAIKAELLW